MRRGRHPLLLAMLLLGLVAHAAEAEILAMVNYETKPEQIVRKEGLAVIDVDPDSPTFGRILMDIPLPHDLINHRIFLNRDRSKAYVTAIGRRVVHVLDLTRFPYRVKAVEVQDCKTAQDMTFSEDNRIWYLTCMGSDIVIVGDAVTDKPIRIVVTPLPGPPLIRSPQGISIHEGIDRVLIAGEIVTVLEASSGRVLSSHAASLKPMPPGALAGSAMFFHPSDPPVAYVTNMSEGTLWLAVWNRATRTFAFRQADDYAQRSQGVPLAIEYNRKGDRLYVTTAKPGHVNVYDIGDPQKPRFLKAIRTAPGAHHLVFSPDERYLFVQNSLLHVPGMSDGSISVIDVAREEPVASVDTFKNQGLDPNSIVLLAGGERNRPCR